MNAMFSDDEFFPSAEQFNPVHHLDEEGRFKRCEEFIPFGIGKRLKTKVFPRIVKTVWARGPPKALQLISLRHNI
jgi:hypothetical protein